MAPLTMIAASGESDASPAYRCVGHPEKEEEAGPSRPAFATDRFFYGGANVHAAERHWCR